MFTVLRTKKLKKEANLQAALNHNNRSRDCIRIDSSKSKENIALKEGTLDDYKRETAGIKIKKDNVRAVEFVMSASPAFFNNKSREQINAWGMENIKFIESQGLHILDARIHLDETTPHAHIVTIPIDSKKVQHFNRHTGTRTEKEKQLLNAAKWLNGRKLMSQLQDNYAAFMSRFGLHRGVSRRETGISHVEVGKLAKISEHREEIIQKQRKELIQAQLAKETVMKALEQNRRQAEDVVRQLVTENAHLKRKLCHIQKQQDFNGNNLRPGG